MPYTLREAYALAQQKIEQKDPDGRLRKKFGKKSIRLDPVSTPAILNAMKSKKPVQQFSHEAFKKADEEYEQRTMGSQSD